MATQDILSTTDSGIEMNDISITKSKTTRIEKVDWNNLGFGIYFSDHIYVSEYKDGSWSRGEIKPYHALEFEPTMATLHYGQSIFEGLKAFRTDYGANLFRPDMNAARLNRSAERVCIPQYDEELFVEACKELIKVDSEWIPTKRGQSLYIRPVTFGSGNFLGVHASDTYKFIIMTSPVASYYKEGLNPVKILVSHEWVRAVRGGLGGAKTAANYAASLFAGKKAKELGFSQVLWLDGVERRYIDEVGAMNIMFVIDDELITPPIEQGSILPGVTRDSVLTLAKEWGMKVTERPISIDEVYESAEAGKLQEVFGTGTAAVISPVGLLSYKGTEIIINDQKIGPVAQKMYDTIQSIQYGDIEDNHNWIQKIII